MDLAEEILRFNEDIKPEGWQIDVLLETDTLIREKGLEYMSSKGDILLALCLNNGYYKRENVYRILSFALSFSNRVQIFATDGPAKHNYRALGKPEDEVIRATRLGRNRLHNQCNEALARFNAKLPTDQQRIITFMDWEAIYADPAYQSSYTYLKELYQGQEDFKADIDRTSSEVLMNRIGIEKEVEAVLSIGIEYVLEELAFILSYLTLAPETKPVPDHGTQGFNYTYYEPWPVFEKLVNGTYDARIKEGIGFVVNKIEVR